MYLQLVNIKSAKISSNSANAIKMRNKREAARIMKNIFGSSTSSVPSKKVSLDKDYLEHPEEFSNIVEEEFENFADSDNYGVSSFNESDDEEHLNIDIKERFILKLRIIYLIQYLTSYW